MVDNTARGMAKNAQINIDNVVKTFGSGSPKGTYSTLTLLQNAYPTGTTGIYVVIADGNWYYWNGLAWVSGGVYQATQVDGMSITQDKLARKSIDFSQSKYFQRGKNIFNKNTAINGYYIHGTSGEARVNAAYYASDFIPVEPNESYYIPSPIHFAFYDKNKKILIGYEVMQTNPITVPNNAYYLRVSVVTANINTYQIELGSVATSYENYGEFISTNSFKSNILSANTIMDFTLSQSKTNFIKTGKNLYNKNTITSGYYVASTTGNLSTNASYAASDYIPVSPSTTYTRTYDHQMAYFDINKVYISGITSGLTFTTPTNCYYLRTTVPVSNLNQQLELGNISTPIEDFKYYIDYYDINNDVLAFLPNEICIAVDRTIELYNKQVVWCGNPDNYHFKWVCDIGKSMKRKWTCTGVVGKIGNHTLTLTVYDNNMKAVANASTIVKIVSSTMSTSKNILTIGDSLTNNKPWLGELRSLSSNQITMVGTRGTAPLKHEGRSGFTAAQYLAATTYTFENEGVQPFWDATSSRFNWNYYKSTTGVNPDAVQIFLGTNGIAVDPTANANAIKQIVDYIRQDDINIPILLVYTLYRGDQNGIGNQTSSDGYSAGSGVWKLEEDRKVFNLMKRLNDLLNTYTKLYFVPISLCHDSEYNFGAVSTAVNPRATQTELLPVEATHPQDQGYYQMADIMYSVIAAHLNS